MKNTAVSPKVAHGEPHPDVESKTFLGFWLYLMTDCVLFSSLFAVYAVLHDNTFGGPSSKDLFDLPYALVETLILLTSSFLCGIALHVAHQNRKKLTLILLGITLLLGFSFLAMEVSEFTHLVQAGNSWKRSAFLSSFFTLVGTHGLHISLGSLWMIVLMVQIFRSGLTPIKLKRLTCFSMFWHFLDVIWIFIFTFVYLMGAK